MAHFSQEQNYNWGIVDNYIAVNGRTDNSSYNPGASIIQFSMSPGYDWGGRPFNYTLTLERQVGGNWIAEELISGSFTRSTTRSFTLHGKPSGTYRIKGYFGYDTQPSAQNQNITGTFLVRRSS